MKAIIAGALVIILVIAGFLVYRSTTWETYTAEDYKYSADDYKTLATSELKKSPDDFFDNKVMIEGNISRECPTGCWFYLQGNAGEQVKIELAFSNFVIPRSAGKKVRAFGRVEIVNGQPVIIADRVQIK
jgi:hypothetical protein